MRVPFKPGTPEFDAYFPGNERGHVLYRAELQRRKDAQAEVVERVFFADADVL